MTRELNLNDIQGNVTRAYGRYSFPFARYIFFHIPIGQPEAGRKFLDEVRQVVTTAKRWPDKASRPKCTVNVALTFPGMLALQLPVRTMQAFPDEFLEGMKQRAFLLGDRDQNVTEDEANAGEWDKHWDPIWRKSRKPGTLGFGEDDVHIMVTLNAQSESDTVLDKAHPMLEENTVWLGALAEGCGVRQLEGVGAKGDKPYQDASAVFENVEGMNVPTAKEHFGFTDGIGNPVFEGQLPDEIVKDAVIGRGKLMGNGWEPLATGEFILGHPDESQELPPAAMPPEFMHNGTFFAFRKLHENVGSFDEVVTEEAKSYAAVMGIEDLDEAVETIRAKMCGRWSDGVPLSKVPTYSEWVEYGKKHGWGGDAKGTLAGHKANLAYIATPEARDFRYADDMAGFKCPGGAHMRRMNTRDYLDPVNKGGLASDGDQPKNPDATSALNKRRRILRRGLPYGPIDNSQKTDETEQGVIMIIMGASLFRQFEFVQQQWIQYGLD
ncbi:MAG: peroxidase, partial [Pseudomonadota bacterium]